MDEMSEPLESTEAGAEEMNPKAKPDRRRRSSVCSMYVQPPRLKENQSEEKDVEVGSDLPKPQRQRRRRSSVGMTFGAAGKAGFCHRADGKSNAHVQPRVGLRENQSETTATANAGNDEDFDEMNEVESFIRELVQEPDFTQIDISSDKVIRAEKKSPAARKEPVRPFRKSLFAFPALPSFPVEGNGRSSAPILQSVPLPNERAASAPGTHPAPRCRKAGHTIYPRTGFCVSMEAVPCLVSTAPFKDHPQRGWLEGRNHPDDKKAALNSNLKLRAKWDSELQERNNKISQRHAAIKQKELADGRASRQADAADQRAYVEHTRTQKIRNREMRRMRQHTQQEHKLQCNAKQALAEQIAQHNTELLMQKEEIEQAAMKHRAQCRQQAVNKRWDAQNKSLRRNTAAYRERVQVESPRITTTLRSLYHWCPSEERTEPKKRPMGKVLTVHARPCILALNTSVCGACIYCA